MASVHLAVAEGPGDIKKLVVIKQITASHTDDPEFVTMFLDEARLSARLRHPNVVQVHEVGEADGRPFMVMEYLDGQSLSEIRRRFARRGGIPLALHLRVISATLRGLHHAHELTDVDGVSLDVVHRDVSPGNIFVTYDGAVRVVDFGIAKARDAQSHTQVGTIKGKVSYMPPEQALARPLDRRTDIFAVGVILWEAATNTRMWQGVSGEDVLHRLARGQIPEVRSVCPDIPEALEAIIRKATAARRIERFATAADFADELDRYIESIDPHAHLRDLGHLVATCFEDERAQIRRLVQKELATPAPRAQPSIFDPVTPMPVVRNVSEATQSAAATVPAAPAPAAPAKRQLPVGMVAAVFACALAITGTVVLQRGGASRAPSQAALPAQPAPVVAPLPPVKVRIAAQPSDAKLFLDGVPLGQNPYVGEVPAGDGERVLRIEAPGHEPRVERISLSRDRELTFVLKPAVETPEPTRPASMHGASPLSSAAGQKSARRIDTVNPYTRKTKR